jgi:hypothetical protein
VRKHLAGSPRWRGRERALAGLEQLAAHTGLRVSSVRATRYQNLIELHAWDPPDRHSPPQP